MEEQHKQGPLMHLIRSDAYYLARLLERLEHLEGVFSAKLSPQAELTRRTRTILTTLHRLLTQGDQEALELLEFTVIPKVNRLLLDARQELKLKDHIQRAGKTMAKESAPKRLAIPAPLPPLYQSGSDETREALIEDALIKLKMLLSAS